MILLGLDLETTGLDFITDEITEIAWGVFDSERSKKPMVIRSLLLNVSKEIPKEIEDMTCISNMFLKVCGNDFFSALGTLRQDIKRFNVQAFVAHNGLRFDKPMLDTKIEQHGYEKFDIPWIDTKLDVPYPANIKSRNLIGLAAEHEFLNPFPHSAVFDVFTMMKILMKYDVDAVYKTSQEPLVVVKALVDFNNKDLAKKRGYIWQELDGKFYEKSWVKVLRESQVQKEQTEAQFTVAIQA